MAKSLSGISVEDWFELLVESGVVPGVKMANLMSEANELTAIFVTIIKRTKEDKLAKSPTRSSATL